MAKWYVPAILTGLVVGGVAYLRKQTLTAKPGDFVAVNPATLSPAAAAQAAAQAGTPFTAPADARLLVRIDAATPDAISGAVVGFSSASSPKQANLLFGGAGGFPVQAIPRAAIVAIYRGSPLKLVD